MGGVLLATRCLVALTIDIPVRILRRILPLLNHTVGDQYFEDYNLRRTQRLAKKTVFVQALGPA